MKKTVFALVAAAAATPAFAGDAVDQFLVENTLVPPAIEQSVVVHTQAAPELNAVDAYLVKHSLAAPRRELVGYSRYRAVEPQYRDDVEALLVEWSLLPARSYGTASEIVSTQPQGNGRS